MGLPPQRLTDALSAGLSSGEGSRAGTAGPWAHDAPNRHLLVPLSDATWGRFVPQGPTEYVPRVLGFFFPASRRGVPSMLGSGFASWPPILTRFRH